MKTYTKLCGATLVLIALLLSGCGGSSGDGGVAPPPPPPPPPPTGGITRTGVAIAVGPITGFGSVIVNGTIYDTSTATFSKDGQDTTQAAFAVGQMVLVQGTIDDDNSNAVATSVRFEDNVEGPVTSVDSVNNIIVVLGQTVLLSAGTSFDDNCPSALDDLLGVPAVEVSGPINSNADIEATRIECRAVAGEFEVTGAVSGLNAGAMTFMINALLVDYSAAALDNFPGGVLTDGDPVEAKGVTIGAGGELIATRVEFKGSLFDDNEGDHIEVEGFITRFISDQDFDVFGIPVTTMPGTTVYEGGTATDLGLNLKVEVEGEFNGSGVLVATKVDIKSSTAVRVTGLVDSVSGDTLVILGISINTDAINTRFEDKTDADVDPLHIGDINTGNYVEARGQELPVGQVTASLVERDDARTRSELRGFVETGGVSRPNLTVLGVTIVTDGSTIFRDSNKVAFANADDFWAAVGDGSLIDMNGTETGVTTLLATEVELEME
jgi:hypothetical protein